MAGSEERLETFVERLAEAVGHANRREPLRAYCSGLMLPGRRKSIEPMAARLAPERVGAVEMTGAGRGRIRLSCIPDYSADSLHAFLEVSVAPGATAKTDGWTGYPGAPVARHDPHMIGPMAGHLVLPWVHRVFADLKRWALGVYHGLRTKHFQAYLDEFVFRFNRRHGRPAAFHSPLGIGSRVGPITYKMLIVPEATG